MRSDSKASSSSPAFGVLWLTLALSAGCSTGGSAATGSAGNGNDGAVSTGSGGPGAGGGRANDGASGSADRDADGVADASDASLDGPSEMADAGAAGRSAVRPRVFMALHGSNHLADSDASVDDQWTYVRGHLDGIWGNNANLTAEEEAKLFYKVKTRTLITEDPIPTGNAGWIGVGAFSGAQAAHPDLVIDREAIALYTGNPADWNGRTVASANANFVTTPQAPSWQLYKAVFTGWQPQEFQTPLSGAAAQAFKDAKGTFFECPLDGCAGGGLGQDAINIITAIHAQGDPFVWFASNNTTPPDPNWPSKFKRAYNFFANQGLWQPRDVVMIINYGGQFQDVPETVNGQDAPTACPLGPTRYPRRPSAAAPATPARISSTVGSTS